MQCHVEVTEDMIRKSIEVNAEEIAINRSSPAVQAAEEMLLICHPFATIKRSPIVVR